VSIDTDGARLKLKGRVVVYLDAEFTVDQLTRWVKTTLITDGVSEKDFVRAEPLSAGDGHVADFMDAYLSGADTLQPRWR
jgi:hypothetical protein